MWQRMINVLTGKKPASLTGKIDDKDAYVHQAYESAINYYRHAGKVTKRSYKIFRFLTIFLGALVTLISSLAATKYVESWPPEWQTAIVIATPVIAATLSIITGLSQSFQWGSTWRDISIHAQKITAERDRFLATDFASRNHAQELETLNKLLMQETESFFQRILDSRELVALDDHKEEEGVTTKSATAAGTI